MSLLFICLLSVSAAAKNSPWVTGYYGGWWLNKNGTALKPENIDYSALTHLIYFGLGSREDGSVDRATSNIGSPGQRQLVKLAHGAGVKVLIDVGGRKGIQSAVSGKILFRYLKNIIAVVRDENFDGVDVDWEPLIDEDTRLYAAFIVNLRNHLDLLERETRKHYLITVAVADQPALFAILQSYIDQINLMTYDLSGLWLGVTWHNSPLFGAQAPDMASRERLPSIDEMSKAFVKAGVKKAKIGIGLEFYGYLWDTPTGKGVYGPRQSWATPPEIDDGLSDTDIFNIYMPKGTYHWDKKAQVPYLSQRGPENTFFISYENERSCALKVKFVKKRGFGGVMIWELGGQWLPAEPVPDPLLQSIKRAVRTAIQAD